MTLDMSLFRRQGPFSPKSDGSFNFGLSPSVRHWLIAMAQDAQELAAEDQHDTRRLFPTAYPEDPELDAGYQILARQQLMDQRQAAIALMRDTVDSTELQPEEFSAWMSTINDLRLILGTRLDVGEDDMKISPDDPDLQERLAYEQLGELLYHMVEAMSATLPPGGE